MEKVKCLKCGSVGYTAAPGFVTCNKCYSEKLEVVCAAKNSNINTGSLSEYLKTLVRFNGYPISRGPKSV